MKIGAPGIGPQSWEVVRGKLDQSLPFANMRERPITATPCGSSSRGTNTSAATAHYEPRCATTRSTR